MTDLAFWSRPHPLTVQSMSLDMLRAPAWDTLIIILCGFNLRRNEGPVIEATTVSKIVPYDVMRFQSFSFTIYGKTVYTKSI